MRGGRGLLLLWWCLAGGLIAASGEVGEFVIRGVLPLDEVELAHLRELVAEEDDAAKMARVTR